MKSENQKTWEFVPSFWFKLLCIEPCYFWLVRKGQLENKFIKFSSEKWIGHKYVKRKHSVQVV